MSTPAPADARLNRAVGWVYEPGSTFKLIAVSAALEEKLARPDEIIDCQGGKIMLAGHTIHDDKPHYILSLTDMVAESSDVGTIKLALRLGEDRLYRYIRAYGIGSKTGVELPGEERGLLQPPSRWSGISIGEMSIGQEAAVTPLQMITMYSAFANGGMLYQPRIVHDVYLGTQHDALPPAIGRRVLSEHTANTVRQILTTVVDHGTGNSAQLGGYTSAGKTGTAQKIDANGTYQPFASHRFIYRLCSRNKSGGDYSGGYRFAGGGILRGRSGSSGISIHRRADSWLFERSSGQSLALASDHNPQTREGS